MNTHTAILELKYAHTVVEVCEQGQQTWVLILVINANHQNKYQAFISKKCGCFSRNIFILCLLNTYS